MPNARPWSTPLDSAPSDSMAMAGDHSIPIDGAATTTTTPSTRAESGSEIDDRRDHAGHQTDGARSQSPRRSETRPATGATIASSPAARRNTAAMAPDPAPRSSSLSGTSTSIAPKSRPGTRIRTIPNRTALERAARPSPPTRNGTLSGASTRSVSAIMPSPTSETARNIGPRPTTSAAAPARPGQDTGDRRCHRRPDHLATTLARRHPHDPGQRARPMRTRPDTLEEILLVTRTSKPWPSANPMPVRLITDKPISTVCRGPAEPPASRPG